MGELIGEYVLVILCCGRPTCRWVYWVVGGGGVVVGRVGVLWSWGWGGGSGRAYERGDHRAFAGDTGDRGRRSDGCTEVGVPIDRYGTRESSTESKTQH